MFAYNSTFGQPSATSGFGSKPACESSLANNPNAGNSMFNATSTSLFGAKQSSSPLAYTPNFGSSSAPSFTSSVPALGGFALGGTSSTGVFSGASSSSPGFGAFTKPFGGAASAFGKFGSSMASQPSSSGFGAFRASSSALGISSTPSFNFGLGSSNSQSSSALGVPSTPSFNFGVSPSNSQSSFALGVSSTPSFNFGVSLSSNSQSSSALGVSSTPSFNFGFNSSNSQSSSALGGGPVGTTPSLFGTQSFSSGTSTTIGQSVSHGKPKGSRVAGYHPTLVTNDTYIKKGPEKCVSISAMHDYNGKSHDELRWEEDYELRDKAPPVVKSNPFGFLQAFVPSSIKPHVSEPLFTFQTSPTTSNPTLTTSPFAPISTTPASVTTSPTLPPSFPSSFVTPNTSAFTPTCKSPPISPSPTTNNFLTTPPNPLEANLFPSSFVPSSSPVSTSTFSPFGPFPRIMPATTSSTTQNSAPSLSLLPSSSTSVSLSSISSSPAPSFLPTVNQPIQDPQKPTASTVSEKTMSVQSVSFQNPFGTPLLLPHMSTVQYGISSLPVADKPTPVRVTSLLTTRHLSQRKGRLPARKLHPRVPFYCDDEESLNTKMADTLFIIPRENPRALLICPNAKEDHSKGAIVSENEAEVEALMPKLKQKDYYTKPPIQELAAKERAEPGFCQHVKDFVVGRHGFGSIMFVGETDIRKLDLESLVQFDAREVTVYTDASKKPPVGEGLNKPAVVTLLNIKCFDKKTGQQITKGAKMEKYKDLLLKKAREQGAEFVSYNPLKGEWRFRVEHF